MIQKGTLHPTQRLHFLTISIYIIALTPYFLFSGVESALGESFRQVWQIGGLFLLAISLIISNKLLLDKYTVCFGIYQIEILVVTTMQAEFRMGICVTTIAVILTLFIIRNDRLNFLCAISIILVVATLINLITLLQVGTGGFNKVYFIGGKNRLSIVLGPAIYILFLFYHEVKSLVAKSGKVQSLQKLCYLYLVLAAGSMVYGGSGTGIIVASVSVACTLMIDRIRINKKLIYLVLIFFYGCILFSKTIFNSELWIHFTTSLGKDPTLTYRTTVWEGSTDLFLRNPIWGIGKIFEVRFTDVFGVSYYVYEAHNSLLQVLCDGGLVGIILFGTALSTAYSGLDMNNRIHRIVFIANIVLLVNGLTEVVNYNILTIVFHALANSYSIENNPHEISHKHYRGNYAKQAIR